MTRETYLVSEFSNLTGCLSPLVVPSRIPTRSTLQPSTVVSSTVPSDRIVQTATKRRTSSHIIKSQSYEHSMASRMDRTYTEIVSETSSGSIPAEESRASTATNLRAVRDLDYTNSKKGIIRRQESIITQLENRCVVISRTHVPFKCPDFSETHNVGKIENFVVVDGYKFASIDNSNVDDRYPVDWNCTVSDAFILPENWTIASVNWRSELAIQLRSFGSDLVILEDRQAYSTLVQPGTVKPYESAIKNMNLAERRYQPAKCGMKILIMQEYEEQSADEQGTNIDNLILRLTKIEKYINFNGTLYATIDDHDPADVEQGCQKRAAKIPSGWELAVDNFQARAALLGSRYKFGTLCYTLGNGDSFMFGNLDCGNDTLRQLTLGEENGGGTVYWPDNCSRRILIQKSASPAAKTSWDESPVITEYVVQDEIMYASIDNASPYGKDVGCSNVSIEIPYSWNLADPSTKSTQAVLKSVNWGVWCMIMKNGDGLTTGSDTTEDIMEPKAEVSKIPRQITYHRGEPPSNLPLTEGMVWSSQYEKYTQRFYSVNWCNKRILIQSPLRDIHYLSQRTQKALLLYADDQAFHRQFAIEVFERNNIQYVELNTRKQQQIVLQNEDGSAAYYAIFLTDSSLSYEESAGMWVSSLSEEEWQKLDSYSARFGARTVSLSSYPSPELGVEVASDNSLESIVYLQPTPGSSSNMKPVMINREHVFITPTNLLTNLSQSYSVTPYMSFTNTMNPPENNNNIASIIKTSASGAQTLHFFLSTSYGVPHGVVLANDIIAWSTELVEPPEKSSSITLYIVLGVIGGVILLSIMSVILFRSYRWFCSQRGADTTIHEYDKDRWEAENAY
eukprot:CFRG3017T1